MFEPILISNIINKTRDINYQNYNILDLITRNYHSKSSSEITSYDINLDINHILNKKNFNLDLNNCQSNDILDLISSRIKNSKYSSKKAINDFNSNDEIYISGDSITSKISTIQFFSIKRMVRKSR